jgi:hypothetical protein
MTWTPGSFYSFYIHLTAPSLLDQVQTADVDVEDVEDVDVDQKLKKPGLEEWKISQGDRYSSGD